MLLSRTLSRSWLPLAAGALLAPGLRAQQQHEVCYTAQVPLQTTNWNVPLSLPRFDPNVGVLQTIQFTLAGTVTGDAKAESLDAAPSTVQLSFQSTLTLSRPDLSVLATINPTQNFSHGFTAFDGTIDFGGTSGASHVGIVANASQTTSSPPPLSDLALFQGPAGSPGTILLPVKAEATSQGSGAGNLMLQFAQQAGATVTICYTYIARVNNGCNGDGAENGGLDCPCSNNAPTGQPGGCLNQTGNGGLLTASGIPSVSNDTLQLTMSQLPVATQAWFFAGDQSGNGAIAGHGVRCLRGPILRMAKLNIVGNTIPQVGFPPLSVQYGYSAGDVKYYQGFYRVQNDVCAGPLNTTNSLQVIWGP